MRFYNLSLELILKKWDIVNEQFYWPIYVIKTIGVSRWSWNKGEICLYIDKNFLIVSNKRNKLIIDIKKDYIGN